MIRHCSHFISSSSSRNFRPVVRAASMTSHGDGVKIPRGFDPVPFSYRELVSVSIHGINHMGVGVGKVDVAHGDGTLKRTVLVPMGLPGETVLARVYRNMPDHSEADLVEVVTASPDRIEPLCPHFESCGGCQYQHISLDAQRKLKRRQVADALIEAGLEVAPFDDGSGAPSTGLETSLVVRPVEGTLHAYGYRDKLNPQVRYSKNEDGGSVRVGFQRKGGHTVIDIEACVIATDSINRELKAIREAVVRRYASLQPGVPSLAPGLAKHKRILKNGENLLLRSAGPDATFVGTKHEDVIEQRVKGVSFRYKAGEFFQNNSHVLPLLVDFVLGQARGGAGGGTGSECDHLIDAYCGSGLFSLCAARHQAAPGSMEPAFREVVGVEISRVAVASARANAERNGLTGVRFLAGDSAQLFHGVAALLPTERTAVVIDPPRSGCDEPFLRQLLAFAPRKLVYVSCDVVTQARDAAFLTAAVMDSSSDGGIGRSRYCITDCTPFDLFPQTRHIENVITFVKTDC